MRSAEPADNLISLSFNPRAMVSVARTIRSFRRVGFREWWRQLQYIGDAKSGTYIGADE